MNWINYTPHSITLPDGRIVPPSGQVARVVFCASRRGLLDEMPAEEVPSAVLEISPLPPEEADMMVLVSRMVLDAARDRGAHQDRRDLVAPGEVERDAQGRPTRAKSLIMLSLAHAEPACVFERIERAAAAAERAALDREHECRVTLDAAVRDGDERALVAAAAQVRATMIAVAAASEHLRKRAIPLLPAARDAGERWAERERDALEGAASATWLPTDGDALPLVPAWVPADERGAVAARINDFARERWDDLVHD